MSLVFSTNGRKMGVSLLGWREHVLVNKNGSHQPCITVMALCDIVWMGMWFKLRLRSWPQRVVGLQMVVA